jgi:hypothetical protein
MPSARHYVSRAVAVAFAFAAIVAARPALADPPASPPPIPPAQDGVTTRDLLTYSAFGASAVSLVVGVAEAVEYATLHAQSQQDLSRVPAGENVCATPTDAAALNACRTSSSGSMAETVAAVAFGSAAAFATTGLVLLLTRPTVEAGHVDVTPEVSARSAGLRLRLTF